MRDPGTGSDFTPDELDVLEDALDWVGDPAHHADLAAMPAPLRERADEYASILALAREAMPDEDVAPGLLEGILAEARRTAPSASPREQGPSWLDRLRRSFLLPGVALAGTAALLLYVARPIDDAPSLADSAAPAPAAPEAAQVDRREAPAETKSEAKAEESAARKDSPAPAPAMEPSAAVPSDSIGNINGSPEATKPSKAAGGKADKAKKADADDLQPLPGLNVPEEQRVDADKESVRDRLESGDAARRKGRCDLAKIDYAAVAGSTGPAGERARALAGLGLCSEADGHGGDAERYFDNALALDPGVEKWLRGEGEAPRKSTKPKASSKQSKAVADGL